jgi:hypothetical protein
MSLDAASGLDTEKLQAYFHYDYADTPNLYVSLGILHPVPTNTDFSTFSLFAVLTPADGTEGTIKYSFTITDENNQLVCTKEGLSLSPGVQTFTADCTGNAALQSLKVNLVAKYSGITESFTAVFSREKN